MYAKIETKCDRKSFDYNREFCVAKLSIIIHYSLLINIAEGRKRMSEIKLTNEIFFALAKCKDAKSAMAMLKNKGYDVTEEKAESLWSAIQNEILTDEELDKLIGGTTALVSGTNAVTSYHIVVSSGCSAVN